MYKNQLQELAQRSCFNLPSYACIKEGPNHAPRFKASVNFNGEIFESQIYCNTLRQAEHSAAEVALNVLSSRGPSRSLTARVLDETGIYKNLLQETAHRAGLKLPVYTTVRSGPGHIPTFTCSVEIAGMSFTGESAKTKKQAEKNAAIAAWSALNRMPRLDLLTASKADTKEEQVRKRDQNPSKRIFRGHGSTSSPSSSSTHISSQDIEKWNLMDLIMDLGQEGSPRKHISFASLVPPPPPRTTSKILPVQVRSSRPYHANIVPPPLEDHLKDEEEWLGRGQTQNVPKNPSSNDHKEGPESSNSGSRAYGTSSTYKPCHVLSNTGTCSAPIGLISDRSVLRGQYLQPHKIAPAVQIRSVIPVCSAPPPSNSKPPPMTSTGSTVMNSKALVSTQPQGSQVSKPNNPQFVLRGSEFNKLQLGGSNDI